MYPAWVWSRRLSNWMCWSARSCWSWQTLSMASLVELPISWEHDSGWGLIQKRAHSTQKEDVPKACIFPERNSSRSLWRPASICFVSFMLVTAGSGVCSKLERLDVEPAALSVLLLDTALALCHEDDAIARKLRHEINFTRVSNPSRRESWSCWKRAWFLESSIACRHFVCRRACSINYSSPSNIDLFSGHQDSGDRPS